MMQRCFYRRWAVVAMCVSAGISAHNVAHASTAQQKAAAFRSDDATRDGLELIQNGDFSQSANYWKKTDFYSGYLYGQRLAETTFDIVGDAAKIHSLRRGNEHWHAHLLQSGLLLESGKKYRLSFWAKVENSDKPGSPLSIVASLLKDGSSLQVYFEDIVKVARTDEWQEFKLEFTSPVSDDFVRLDLSYGRPKSDSSEAETFDLWLDDISLTKIGDSNDPRVVTADVGSHRPVQQYGALAVNERGQLVSESLGKPVQLRGLSLHGIHWDRPWYYANREALIEVKEKWKTDVIRVPIYLGQGGYIEDRSVLYSVAQIIEMATALDLYVLIDWHVHNDAGNPNTYKNQALDFFSTLSKRYGQQPNVLFEITNEPNGASWTDIKSYAEDVVRVIRQQSANVIIVGTPVWSQEVQTAAENPILGVNLLYTLHFYAASHPLQNFKSKIEAAMAKGIGLFVTEFGTTSYGGDGNPNIDETSKWLDYLDRKGISWVYWNLSAEREESAALKPFTHPLPAQRGGWSDSDLSPSGLYIKNRLTTPSVFNPDQTPADEGPIKVPNGELTTSVTIKSDWGSGYCADVTMINQKADAVYWQVSFEIEGTISSAWKASWTQKGTQVTAVGLGADAELAAGASLQWGFCANR